jgi:membrane protease subunit HflC
MGADGDIRSVRARTPLRRRGPILAFVATLGFVVWLIGSSLFVLDATELATVTRFGRLVRVVEAPGLHLVAPIDRVTRLDGRLLFAPIPRAEFLTEDKRNIVIASLIAWRIADPDLFLRRVATRARAEERLADTALSATGAALGRHSSRAFLGAGDRARAIIAEIRDGVTRDARESYGVGIAEFSLTHVSQPEQNRQSVFERMKAERGRLAVRYRSEGALEAKRIVAAADREKLRIAADAYAQSQALRAEADAEAARIEAAAYVKNPDFYVFVRILQAYDKLLDESTTLLLPLDADAFGVLPEIARSGASASDVEASLRSPPRGAPDRQVPGSTALGLHPGGTGETEAPR